MKPAHYSQRNFGQTRTFWGAHAARVWFRRPRRNDLLLNAANARSFAIEQEKFATASRHRPHASRVRSQECYRRITSFRYG